MGKCDQGHDHGETHHHDDGGWLDAIGHVIEWTVKLFRYVIIPLTTIIAIITWRWITGAAMLTRHDHGTTFLRGAQPPAVARVGWGYWPGWQRGITRIVATTIAVALAIWPIQTIATLATLIIGTAGAAATVRIRARRTRKPRVVQAIRSDQAATWTATEEKIKCSAS